MQDGPNIIQLTGLNVLEKHCHFVNENGQVTILPTNAKDFADTFVNGERVLMKRVLNHGDRVIIGQYHVFRFSNPADGKCVEVC